MAFVPDDTEGREVLALLIEAFRRRFTFAVGFSITRNANNCVIWNGIHHKTNQSGGAKAHGYPDETYYARVKDELKQFDVFFRDDEHKKQLLASIQSSSSIKLN